MSDLFSSLRSLLPQEYGQTSSYDDFEDATNYIKNLKLSIKELEDKRDMLKNSTSKNDQNGEMGSSSNNKNNIINTKDCGENDNYVTIYTFPRRLEIEISVKIGEGNGFPLSKLLKQVALVEGVEVVNCVSSKVDERWKCIIHCDLVNDQPGTDFSELERKLSNEISFYVA